MKNILLIACLFFVQQVLCQSPFTPGKNVHIYLLAGQSNMAGRGKVEGIDSTTTPNIFMFSKNEEWVPAREPLAFDKPKVAGVGPGYAFAKDMAKADQSVIICLVPTAVGGTRIDLWKVGAYDSATKTHPYDDAIRRAKKAMPSGELKGIIWHQGESDASPALIPSYADKLKELIERFRRELNAPAVPFIAGEVGVFTDEQKDRKEINRIIQEVVSVTPYAGMASSKGLMHQGDNTHFDAASARELGKRYAAALLAIKK